MSTLDRREFMRALAAGAAASAATALMPGVVFGQAFEQRLDDAGIVWKKAPCNLCGVGCGLLVGIENGRAVALRGDPDSPVSRGLACVRGYHSVQALYGRDRLTRALVRRDGAFVAVPVGEALDLVARQLRRTIETHGKDAVAIYGSGRSTIPAGYVASKLFRGGIGTNNVESDARLGSGSAIAGLRTSFGLDSSMGCYEDIDHADLFVLWGSNMAETSPVLFSRMLERRRRSRGVSIVDLATRTTRTSYAADRSLLFAPQTDLAIANAICHEIIARGWTDRDFVERHVAFRKGRTGIGYGLGDDTRFVEEPAESSLEEYTRFLADYAPERVQRISGMSAADIRWLASVYADPARRVMSLWGTGVNQHARGTWMNNLLYNIHLLLGKIASPGNSPFALGYQPSACGTVSVAGTLTERLPRGVVSRQRDRERAASIWGVPVQRIDARPTHHAMSLFRALDRGDVRFLWIQGANPMVSLPNVYRYRAAARKEGRFIVVSDAYPTPTTDVADVILPSALWVEQEGLYGSAERRTQHFERMLEPPGEAMSDTWQLIEVARRLGHGGMFPAHEATHVEQVWTELARFHDDASDRLPPLTALAARPGVMWPYVDGRETRWRYNTAHDPAADPARGKFDFHGHADHRARIWLRPYEPAAEAPDTSFPFWLVTGGVLEHAESGSLTRRIPALHRAMPGAYVELNREDATRLDVRDGDVVRLVSRRGSMQIVARIDYRAQPPRGQVFVPVFDEGLLVNVLTLDAFCPISGQPDLKKCAVRVEPMRARS